MLSDVHVTRWLMINEHWVVLMIDESELYKWLYTVLCFWCLPKINTCTTHVPTQTFVSVIYHCCQITPGIGIGTRCQHQSRPKVSVSEASVNYGIGLTLFEALPLVLSRSWCIYASACHLLFTFLLSLQVIMTPGNLFASLLSWSTIIWYWLTGYDVIRLRRWPWVWQHWLCITYSDIQWEMSTLLVPRSLRSHLASISM